MNKLRFRYFANTSAKNCIAFGPGLAPGSKAIFGIEIPFLVCAKAGAYTRTLLSST